MRHLFGPVPSRRLGLSLGVDIIPPKTCTLSCAYCQIGPTPATTVERKPYVPADEVLGEIRRKCAGGLQADWLTISGSGEPTLNSDIAGIIRGIRDITDIPVCVITNATLVHLPEVREALLLADAVLPSLDSAVQETFERICSPHPDIDVRTVIGGLAEFRKRYTGGIWLEILFVRGMNDTETELRELKRAVDDIRPDIVHLNTVVRPPAMSGTRPVSGERLEALRDYFGPPATIIADFSSAKDRGHGVAGEDVLEYLQRRPATLGDIVDALGIDARRGEALLASLVNEGEVREIEHYGKRYWEYTGGH